MTCPEPKAKDLCCRFINHSHPKWIWRCIIRCVNLALAEKAVAIFVKSVEKSKLLLNRVPTKALSDDERETLESLTTRYARALDFLTQKLLRTIDKIELTDDGSNQIAHEYIIDESDQVVHDVLKYSNLIVEMFNNAKSYCQNRGFTKNC